MVEMQKRILNEKEISGKNTNWDKGGHCTVIKDVTQREDTVQHSANTY